MSKSTQAFRTIREVADWLDVAAHVLRFWESKFPQIKPVKRAGGRRYYRPADMELVGGIKVLLHDRGLTIRGVQKMIREDGVAAVAALSPPIDLDGLDAIDAEAVEDWIEDAELAEADETAEVPEPVTAADTEAMEPPTAPMADAAPDPEPSVPEPAPPPAAVEDSMAEPPPMPQATAVARDTEGGCADAIAALVACTPSLSPAAIARLRPAIIALRDRLRAPLP
jgi:DNA-binding transcriptional MerR regulator